MCGRGGYNLCAPLSELHINGLTETYIYSICNTQGNVIQTGNLAAGGQTVSITSLAVGYVFYGFDR